MNAGRIKECVALAAGCDGCLSAEMTLPMDGNGVLRPAQPLRCGDRQTPWHEGRLSPEEAQADDGLRPVRVPAGLPQ